MSSFQFNDLLSELVKSKPTVAPVGVSFQGRGLKLNSKEDCDEVIKAIDSSPDMTFLDLEGNTLGVDAAAAIGEALKTRQKLHRALWKDLFTGRMKTEIPPALESLTAGLQTAFAKLTVLDLSDNAFGPIGVEALAKFLQSPVCYGLQELRLNNNGLGITGGKLLAAALMNTYQNSLVAGSPFALKIFIAGRNRLENDGSSALAEVFKTLGSLEEISMPQNGIYHKGITKLSDALTRNTNLRLLNLNDNTLTAKGAASLAAALPALQKLELLNLGDCLLKTKGAVILAEALSDNHAELQTLILDSNEIRTEGGLAIIRAMKNKKNLKTLSLSGNEFGDNGRSSLKREAQLIHIEEILECPSDDDAEASEGEENEGGSDEEEETEDESSEENSEEEVEKTPGKLEKPAFVSDPVIGGFLANPSTENFFKLTEKDFDAVTKTLQTLQHIPSFIQLIMKVSDSDKNPSIKQEKKEFALKLYKALFTWAESENLLPAVNNELFVHLKLIKGEDEEFKINWDTDCCVRVLEDAIVEKIVPDFTQHILSCCKQRKNGVYEEIVLS